LEAGAIPVYLGAPNIDEFAPGENCFVDAAGFSSPRELARFLQDADPAEFHCWRSRPLRACFNEKIARTGQPWQDRLADAIRNSVRSRC
jgi:hypothetical protein